MEPTFAISPKRSAFTEDLNEFKVSGLQPFNIYRIQLVLQHKGLFVSYAFFLSDKQGEIDLSKSAPLWGYYKGVDMMGLITSLYQDPSERFGTKLNLTPVPESLTYRFSVHQLEELKSLTETEIERVVLSDKVVRETLEHSSLEGVIFHPRDHEGPMPCVIDISGVGGSKEHRAAFLAAEGFYVISLALYGKSDKLPKRHEDVNTEYVLEAIDYITSLPNTADKVSIIGTSLGGTWAYHVATRSSKVTAAVSINGQGAYYYVSQMKENGKRIPFVPVTPEAMTQIEIINGCQSYAKMYGSCKASEKHLIPIESLEASQKLFYIASEGDKAIDALQQGETMRNRMKASGKEEQFTMEIAKKGCHVIDPPYMPICDVVYVQGKFFLFGGDPYVSGCEQRRLWPKVLDFLRSAH